MAFQTLLYEQKGPIGVLTLNRPERLNAMNYQMFAELEIFWRDRLDDLETRVVILTGAGSRGFCAGLDIKEVPDQFDKEENPVNSYQLQVRGSRLPVLMRQAPQPIICAIHKAAAGGGFAMALASDVRIITPETKFCASTINLGLPGSDLGTSYFLPRMIGAGRASEFLLTGDFIYAEDALKLGLANCIVPFAELMDAAMQMANKMVSKTAGGLRLTKEIINTNLDAQGLAQATHLEGVGIAMVSQMNRMERGRAAIPYFKKD
jgi:enoyl-CoA hydratase/carnithine racemase